MNFDNYLNESSLSRLWKKIQDSDIATITAFRGEYTYRENMNRLSEMKNFLMKKEYSVTKIIGHYIENKGSENEREVNEVSFFVQNNDPAKFKEFKEFMIKLAKKYNQDEVIVKQKGKDAFSIGCSKDNTWLPLGKEKSIGSFKTHSELNDYYSKIRGRKFIFESAEKTDKLSDHGFLSFMTLKRMKEYDL